MPSAAAADRGSLLDGRIMMHLARPTTDLGSPFDVYRNCLRRISATCILSSSSSPFPTRSSLRRHSASAARQSNLRDRLQCRSQFNAFGPPSKWFFLTLYFTSKNWRNTENKQKLEKYRGPSLSNMNPGPELEPPRTKLPNPWSFWLSRSANDTSIAVCYIYLIECRSKRNEATEWQTDGSSAI